MKLPSHVILCCAAVALFHQQIPVSTGFQMASLVTTARTTPAVYLRNLHRLFPSSSCTSITKRERLSYYYHHSHNNRSQVSLLHQQRRNLNDNDESLRSSIRETYAKQGRQIASRPFTWEELVDIVLHKRDLSLHSRSMEEQVRYLRFVAEVENQWMSVNDHILHQKFNFEKRLVSGERGLTDGPSSGDGNSDNDGDSVPSGGNGERLTLEKKTPIGYVWQAHPSLAEVTSPQKALLPNDFPYYMQDGIEHWCLWKLKDRVTEEDIRIAKDHLKQTGSTVVALGGGSDDEGSTASDADSPQNAGVLVDTLHWINPPHLKSVPDIDHAHILCLRR